MQNQGQFIVTVEHEKVIVGLSTEGRKRCIIVLLNIDPHFENTLVRFLIY